MRLNQVPFNLSVFVCLGLQYSLMHLFSAGETLVITSIELVIYIVCTVGGLGRFFYRCTKVAAETVSGMGSFFFSVLWTVALFSQFQKESYPEALTVINSLGVSTACLVLLTELIILMKA